MPKGAFLVRLRGAGRWYIIAAMHATLADVIADTAQNSIEAGARHITLSLTEDGSTIAVKITDDGKGMDEATQARAFNPF